MATTGSIKIVNQFADDSTRNIEFSGLDPNSEAFTGAKARIKAFDPTTISGIYLSDSGASYTGIVGATLTQITEREFNLNDVEDEEEEGGEG